MRLFIVLAAASLLAACAHDTRDDGYGRGPASAPPTMPPPPAPGPGAA